VTAPVAGKVALRANVDLLLNHVSGTFSRVDVSIETTPTDCTSGVLGFDEMALLPAAAPTGAWHPLLHPSKEFSVPPGTYTYYINGKVVSGTGHAFWWGALEATFIPD
jgi:hypothetical protein